MLVICNLYSFVLICGIYQCYIKFILFKDIKEKEKHSTFCIFIIIFI